MVRHFTRLAAAVIAASILTTIGAGPVTAEPYPWGEGRWRGPCSGWAYGENLSTPALFNADPRAEIKMRRLVDCVFHRWAPGNEATALYVAERESGFMPWARNASSGCLGLFQHISSAWPDRARSYLWRGWFRRWPAVWSDPRANAIVAARMVAAGGWGPWSL